MTDKDKAKPAKNVMGNLPSTRPTRMARRRDGEPTRATPKATGRPAAKAGTKTTTKPAPRAKAAPKAKAKPRPTAEVRATATPKPRAVRSGSPSLAAAKKKADKARKPRRQPAPEPPKGAELVTTAVQATGELAKIGLTLGSQALKRAARRLPKP